jgi:hypothetical protein
MCVFCAAIPVAMAIGASAQKSQREGAKKAEEEGEAPPRRLLPAGKATAAAVVGLLAASVIVHTQFGGVI